MRGVLSLLLPGLLLLACHVAPSEQLELYTLPSLAPYPALKPKDKGYPANLPADLPQELPSAPPVQSPGPTVPCTTTVSAVLAANQRTLLAQYLAATPQGQQILSGAMLTTILAPTDAALSYMLNARENGLEGPRAEGMLALYHVLQGTRSLKELSKVSGLYYNTSLTQDAMACQTATQAVTILSAGPTATYARSGGSSLGSARITSGDLAACNSVVHLIDYALQPCCSSLYEELPGFSIVQIQPSYFDGYQPQEPIGNSDSFNRRAFEEAVVDYMLSTTTQNTTHTVLWPSQSAWMSVDLASLLPGVALDATVRVNAMKVLALYSISYARTLLPRDIPEAGGAARAMLLPFQPKLRNATAQTLWSCSEKLSISTAGWSRPVGTTTPTAPPVVLQPSSPASTPVPAAGSSPSPQPSPAPAAASPSPSLVPSPVPTPPNPLENPPISPVMRRLQQHKYPSQQEGSAPIGRRKLQAAVVGDSKTVSVVDVLETCEGTRVLFVDAVPIPCGFAGLVKNFDKIQQAIDEKYATREYKNLAAALYDWALRNGVIRNGQPVSEVRNAAGVTSMSRLQVWAGVLLMGWMSWQQVRL